MLSARQLVYLVCLVHLNQILDFLGISALFIFIVENYLFQESSKNICFSDIWDNLILSIPSLRRVTPVENWSVDIAILLQVGEFLHARSMCVAEDIRCLTYTSLCWP